MQTARTPRELQTPIHAKSGQEHRKNSHLGPQAPSTNVKRFPKFNLWNVTLRIRSSLTAVHPYTCLGLQNLQPTYASFTLFAFFFADSNSSITITQMATLRIPVREGLVVIGNVAFSDKVSGTILSVGRLCREGVLLCLVA
ncbi:hypothetical protein O181_001394 [Austropuccinia psidii MF-1]|uniref:Uncharacterized protein n=1 Tax=Austropuccinia psidii MF-1 TaxID=1389203 RepID=A0A9Q3GBT9_9BASI|nr:hypothetical protein [Austropuccinia psidii MF-1]